MSKSSAPTVRYALAGLGIAAVAAGLLWFTPAATLPKPISVDRAPVKEKTLALTFEQGPDGKNTPAILGVLGKHRTRSTFLLDAQAAAANPALTKRIAAEGHQIGLRVGSASEAPAVQPALAKILGKTPRLFRDDSTPPIPDVDPRDDRLGVNVDGSGERRTPEQVTAAVLWQLHVGGRSSVVRLRDGGGDRQLTAQSLDLLIPQLQAKGYSLVTVADLLNLTKADVMPLVDSESPWTARMLWLLLIASLAYSVLQLKSLLPARGPRIRPDYKYRPTVSVLIPAKDAESEIVSTVRCMLDSDFRVNEVVIVDDGSVDETFLEVVVKLAGEPRVVVLRQEHQGRAAALNHALAHARGEVVVCIDGGVEVTPNAVGALVAYLHDSTVAASMAGPPFAHLLQKRDPDVSAWRRSALVEAGGWTGSDLELASKLRDSGWRIVLKPARHETDTTIPVRIPEAPEREKASLK